jgi:pantoate--beta-alanine ligase
MDIEIVGMPTIREKDGLAMSSRNEYLDREERKAALCLSRALRRAEEMVKSGEVSSARIIAEMKKMIDAEKGTNIDYIEICDPKSFIHADIVEKPTLIALAVKIGKARLIDNCVVSP